MADLGRPRAVGVDLGGTNLRVALVADDGTILERRRVPTPTGSADAFLDVLVEVHAELTEAVGRELPVGLGVASLVRDSRRAVYGPNVDLGEVDLVAALAERGLDDVVVENDATAAMYGEWCVGAARGHDNALMLTLGTGVGGGAIVHGRLLQGGNGFGGEAGHVTLVVDGRTCACGRKGCLEAYASGGAIAVTARSWLAEGRASSLVSLDRLDEVDTADVVAAAGDGDALAQEALAATGRWLGEGLVGLVNLLDPTVVVVGGGVAQRAGEWILPTARRILGDGIEGHGHRPAPPVVPAELGDDAGLVGAALLAQHGEPTGPQRVDTTSTTGRG